MTVDWGMWANLLTTVMAAATLSALGVAFFTGRGKNWMRMYLGVDDLKQQHNENSAKLDRAREELSNIKVVVLDEARAINELSGALRGVEGVEETPEVDSAEVREALFTGNEYGSGDFLTGSRSGSDD